MSEWKQNIAAVHKPHNWASYTLAFMKTHRLHIIIFLTVGVYLSARLIRLEFLGHGCELLIEPTIEQIMERFVSRGSEP
jgi:hypothetical protein